MLGGGGELGCSQLSGLSFEAVNTGLQHHEFLFELLHQALELFGDLGHAIEASVQQSSRFVAGQCNVALEDLTVCGSIFKLPRHDKKHLALCRHLSSHSIASDDKENKTKKDTEAGDWTPEHIQQIKSELKVPMQRSKKRRLEEKKVKTEGGRDI